MPNDLHGIARCPVSINLKPSSRVAPEDIQSETDLKASGAFKVLHEAMPRLRKANGSSIVFYLAVAVQIGFKLHTMISSTKGAVEGQARALATELPPKVRVNFIAASLTDTPLPKTCSIPTKNMRQMPTIIH